MYTCEKCIFYFDFSAKSSLTNNNASAVYKTIANTKGANATDSVAYYDEIDGAWLYMVHRVAYDENNKSNYRTICKRSDSGKCIYTPKSLMDGTDYPLKSGNFYVTRIIRWNKFYLVSCRSEEGNIPSDGVDNTSIWGYLFVLNVDDLSVAAVQSFNAKCSNVNIISTKYMYDSTCYICVSCQMSYFQVFKLNLSDTGEVTISAKDKTYFKAFSGTSYDDIRTDIQEFQCAKTYITKTKKLLISAGFGDGIHIVDFSSVNSTGKYTAIYSYLWLDHLDVVGQDYSPVNISSKAGSTFEVALDYPYVYCTFAQPTTVIKAYNNGTGDCRVQGVLALDITDLENITAKLHTIPLADCQSNADSDPKPCSIVRYGSSVYLGMGNKGIAKFDVDGINAEYKGLTKVGRMSVIRHVAMNNAGELFAINMDADKPYQSNGISDEIPNIIQYSTIIDVSSI